MHSQGSSIFQPACVSMHKQLGAGVTANQTVIIRNIFMHESFFWKVLPTI